MAPVRLRRQHGGRWMRFGLIEVFTPDLAEADRFYGDTMGFALIAEASGQLVFDIGGAELHVFQCERPSDLAHASTAATVCAFEVDSIDRAMKVLHDKGVRFLHRRPAENPVAGIRYAAFKAPGGNVHELIERRRPA